LQKEVRISIIFVNFCEIDKSPSGINQSKIEQFLISTYNPLLNQKIASEDHHLLQSH